MAAGKLVEASQQDWYRDMKLGSHRFHSKKVLKKHWNIFKNHFQSDSKNKPTTHIGVSQALRFWSFR